MNRSLRAVYAAMLICVFVGAPGCRGEDASDPAPAADGPAAEAPVAPALAPGVLCALTGAAEDEVSCPLTLDLAAGAPDVAALQLTLKWDAKAATALGLAVDVCDDVGTCRTAQLPPATTLPATGHRLASRPPEPQAASGELGVMLFHPSVPDAALPREGLAARFRLASARPASDPLLVRADRVVLSSADARELPATLDGGTLHVGAVAP